MYTCTNKFYAKPDTRFPIKENIWDMGFLGNQLQTIETNKNSMVSRDAFRVFRLNQESIPENFDDAKRGLQSSCVSIDPGIVCLIVPSAQKSSPPIAVRPLQVFY